MVVRMRSTRAHTANRRSHHALTIPRLSRCGNCGAAHLTHRVCEGCGQYRGRQVIDIVARMERKERRTKAKEKARGK
ncbi:MAG: 50S ribosomal protein L32 [bacterium]|nr:50S ribosomal protein L32 [bacterium]MDZ4284604.1 50S ribosomal protein L32 [Patescibacteria group bacterium]